MSYQDDDFARIAVASLFEHIISGYDKEFINLIKVSNRLGKYIYDLKTGRMDIRSINGEEFDYDAVSILHEGILLTKNDKIVNEKLAQFVNQYIKHVARRKPRPHLTISYLRACQQQLGRAISAHGTGQAMLTNSVLLSVMSNTNLMQSSMIPQQLANQMAEYAELKDRYMLEHEERMALEYNRPEPTTKDKIKSKLKRRKPKGVG